MDLIIILNEILGACKVLKIQLDRGEINLKSFQEFNIFFRENKSIFSSLDLKVSDEIVLLENRQDIWCYINKWKGKFKMDSYNDENVAAIHELLDVITFTLNKGYSNSSVDNILFEIFFQIYEIVIPNNLEPLLDSYGETILR